MTSYAWLRKDVVVALHDEQLAEHGGAVGLRDEGLLESALARPRNMAAYGEPDLADLAAAYAFGLGRNHPFIDGNKRTSLVAAVLFIRLNGFDLDAGDADVLDHWAQLAAGTLSEAELAAWLRARLLTPPSSAPR